MADRDPGQYATRGTGVPLVNSDTEMAIAMSELEIRQEDPTSSRARDSARDSGAENCPSTGFNNFHIPKTGYPAFADFVDPRLRLLNSEAHRRPTQQIQEGIGSVASLLLSDGGRRSRRGRSAGFFDDLLHTAVVACTKLLVHLHDLVCELLDLSAIYIAMILLEQTFK